VDGVTHLNHQAFDRSSCLTSGCGDAGGHFGSYLKEKTMIRTWLTIATAISVGACGMSFAVLHEDGESVKTISVQEIKEKLDGKEASATVVEVTLGPGQSGLAHRHPGPGFVYVLEGTYELGIDDQPTKTFKAGETFYEPTGCLHRVSRNPATKGTTRLIAVVLHPRGAKEIAVPEAQKMPAR
jgi:quercetin dioxygenase-like cupin family protein